MRSTTVGAGSRGQTRELVERMFGIETPGRTAEETDERRTLPALGRARSGSKRRASLERF